MKSTKMGRNAEKFSFAHTPHQHLYKSVGEVPAIYPIAIRTSSVRVVHHGGSVRHSPRPHRWGGPLSWREKEAAPGLHCTAWRARGGTAWRPPGMGAGLGYIAPGLQKRNASEPTGTVENAAGKKTGGGGMAPCPGQNKTSCHLADVKN